ncbi:GNAT family N-acetyltransferase [Pseudonocardia sp. H11422]|uniref:GNAT family N-acetyltransferase n=1 Tax=Pseudonocardia sp. H11422 TaxID=2835866 RepID=UPI001BDC7CC9|nr:GNAT family N-acetyltransferase [Pseudonocardia sp. H11422]
MTPSHSSSLPGSLERTAESATATESAETPHANAIFQQPWWLDAVAPGCWEEVTVERGGVAVARLPYVIRGRGGLRVLTQPPLTATLGPWVARSPGAKEAKAVGDELELLTELEASLPPAQAFRQNFSPVMLNALPFHWAGYRAEVRYTYRLEGLGSEQELWDGLSGNIRREIRKARQRVEVREGLGLDRFHGVWAKTFERQGLGAPDADRLARLEAACAPRGARAMLFAIDEADRIHAVAYVVWDRHAAYYLLGGGDPELRTSGASSLLMWEAIMRARAVTDVFDFEGSMLKPVERFFRAFGGRQTPYLHVSRASRPAEVAFAVRATMRRLAARRTG